MNIQWHIRAFGELGVDTLYALLRLRSEVFVVEQDCVYQDCDNQDQDAYHILGYERGTLVAYARVFVQQDQTVIGRIVIARAYRGQGLGRALMQQVMVYLQAHPAFPATLYLMAQAHLAPFYQSIGFSVDSEPYDEDGIMHCDMTMALKRV